MFLVYTKTKSLIDPNTVNYVISNEYKNKYQRDGINKPKKFSEFAFTQFYQAKNNNGVHQEKTKM